MKHVSAQGFVHRDLAARNVLVDSRLLCRISDFGLSRGIDSGSASAEYRTSGAGYFAVRWTAPEAIKRGVFTTASDVWSFGVVGYEIFTDGERPYLRYDNSKVISWLESGHRLPRPVECEPQVYDVLLRCWNPNPTLRPTFAALTHFFEGDRSVFMLNPDDAPPRPQTLPHVARNAARSPHSAELEPAVADLPETDAQPAEEWYFDLGLAKYSTTV